jgi:DDE superfamily endonuclease/Transposase
MPDVPKKTQFLLHCLALHAKGYSHSAISAELSKKGFRASKTTVGNKLRWVLSGGFSLPKKKAKSRCKLDTRDLRHIRRCIRFLGDRSYQTIFDTYLEEGKNISYSTVRRAVKKIPTIVSKRPRKRQYLTDGQKSDRLQWATKHANLKTNWAKHWFSDQKWWSPDGPGRRRPVLCDKADKPPIVEQTAKRNQAVSVWAAFSSTGATDLVELSTNCTTEQYLDVLENHFLTVAPPSRRRLFQDRQTAYKSKCSIEWQKQQGMQPTLFPAKGADINPIENLWAILQHRVFGAQKIFHSRKSLLAALRQEWDTIRQDRALLGNLVSSMPKRIEQVIERKGGHIDF